MISQVINRLKTRKDARLYERTFLHARKQGESLQQVANRLYCEGRDETALAYELLDSKFPNLYANNHQQEE